MAIQEKLTITKGAKAIIEEAICEADSCNRYDICAKVAEIVENKYTGMNLDYQLKRMNIETTKQILSAIDIFFYTKD